MGQVGHADSKMTLDVYAKLQQRVKRQHGAAFDRLLRCAREQLKGADAVSTGDSPVDPNPTETPTIFKEPAETRERTRNRIDMPPLRDQARRSYPRTPSNPDGTRTSRFT